MPVLARQKSQIGKGIDAESGIGWHPFVFKGVVRQEKHQGNSLKIKAPATASISVLKFHPFSFRKPKGCHPER